MEASTQVLLGRAVLRAKEMGCRSLLQSSGVGANYASGQQCRAKQVGA